MPKISVIIPTYNRSSLLKQAIDSVLQQTFNDFEVIVVDDGSTDDTRDVIKQIGDERIRYFYKDNGGASSARNLGLIKAQGEYISFLDSDDLWPENYLEIMVSNLEKMPDYGAAYSLFKNYSSDGRVVDEVENDYFTSGWLTKLYYQKALFISPCASIFRKCVWNNFWWDEAIEFVHDTDAFLRISTKTKFLFVPHTYVKRRLTPNSLSYLNIVNLSLDTIFVLERFYFHLGGDKIVPAKIAKYKINREYRDLARRHYRLGHRRAAILLFKKAITYCPLESKNYKWLLRALLLSKKNDKMPDWQIPKPLPISITVKKNSIAGRCNRKILTSCFIT